jgi:hypothetical protein
MLQPGKHARALRQADPDPAPGEDCAPNKLELTHDQALLLYRAAVAGLKGSQPVPQDPATARGLMDALTEMALRLIKDTPDA